MKTKLKKINLNGQNFWFTVSRNYGLPKDGMTLSVRVFLDNFKETFLTIDFDAELVDGENPYFKGVEFLNAETGEKELITAANPELILKYIKLAKQKGWNGRSSAPVLGGLELLKEWGYKELGGDENPAS